MAVTLVFCGASASAGQIGSDGKPLNGIALLYAHLPSRQDGAGVDATLALPAVPSNASWYANWIMIVGQSPGMAHQTFVQIGLIRRPPVARGLHYFIAWQRAKEHAVRFRQLARVSEGAHRFAIARSRNGFVLWADNREIERIDMPSLAAATRVYAQVGPEVYAQGDAASGIITYIGIEQHGGWRPFNPRKPCRYANHGLMLRRRNDRWVAAGRFENGLPSGFHGDCRGI